MPLNSTDNRQTNKLNVHARRVICQTSKQLTIRRQAANKNRKQREKESEKNPKRSEFHKQIRVEKITIFDCGMLVWWKMTHIQSLFVLTTLLLQMKWTWSQPADLGAFGTQNDVQPGAIYSFPSEIGRSHPSTDIYASAFINYTYTRQDGQHVVYGQETAKYGEGQIAAVSGKLVHVVNAIDLADHTACKCDILGTNGQPLPEKGWIALIKRGECKFDEKVACVYSNGAIGAIVYDFKNNQILDKMKIDDKTRKYCSPIQLLFNHTHSLKGY